MYEQRVLDAIKAIRNGEMIIIMDDEDRENEGDLVFAAEFCTPDKVNFLAKQARGLICVSIKNDLAKKLDLPFMVHQNSSNHQTAFTISIDAKDAKTGISAFERSLTIELMCKDTSTKDDFVRPGHIFPLIAKDGGVLVRTGHTEASIDICKLAGLKEIGVICELMKDDGSMPGHGDKFISDFAKIHNLKILYVKDLVKYRLCFERLVSCDNESKEEFMGKECIKYTFKDHLGSIHTAYKFKGEKEVPTIKLHRTGNVLSLMQDFKRFNQLIDSIELIKKEGGILVFLQDNTNLKDINKSFGIGAQILHYLDIKQFNLIDSKHTSFIGLEGFNLELVKKIHL